MIALGHIQRGSAPNGRDREIATCMGYFAVKALSEGRMNTVIGTRSGDIVENELEGHRLILPPSGFAWLIGYSDGFENKSSLWNWINLWDKTEQKTVKQNNNSFQKSPI